MTDKPVAFVVPSWNPDEPRFVVKDCPMCGEDRVFKNNKCVFNQRLGFAYSVDEIVEVLNNQGDELDRIKETIRESIKNERTDMGKSVLKQLYDTLYK